MKNQNLFYGSSYDRGLQHLLNMWPDIIKEVPEVQLHIAYGWDLFDKAYSNNPERMAWKDRISQQMKQPGITHYGRVSKGKLEKIRKECGIWVYPTHFTEINCITALEAQAAGLVPVVINLAALKETVKSGIKIDGDIYDPEIKETYKKELISLLKDKDRWSKLSSEAKQSVTHYNWENIAKEWINVF